MRTLWGRIGIGAGVVFATGLFVVTLARQVRTAAADAIREGGNLRVPLSLLPFEVNGRNVGSVRGIRVEKAESGRVKQIRLQVHLKGFDPASLGDCVLVVGPPGGHRSHLFDCVSLTEADALDLIQVGEVRFEPGEITRPIAVDRHEAAGWFDAAGAAEVQLRVRDPSGREVVKLQAGSGGVNLKVDATP